MAEQTVREQMAAALEAAINYLPATNPAMHSFWRKWLRKAGLALDRHRAEPEEPS